MTLKPLNRKRSSGLRGFTLIEMIAASSIGIILAGTMVGVVSDALTMKRSFQAQDQMGQLRVAIEKYYRDTGQFPNVDAADPTGTGVSGLMKLYVNLDGVANWKGPYLTGDPGAFTTIGAYKIPRMLVDPWQKPLYYGWAFSLINLGGNGSTGIPVAYVGSSGRNRVLDSNLAGFNNPPWDPGGDDIFRKVTSSQSIQTMEQLAYRQLETIRGILYAGNPHVAPHQFNTTQWKDPWGSTIVYIQCTDSSAVVYSFGPNHTDNNNNGVDICNTTQSAKPDDIFVTASWGQQTHVPWEGGEYSEPTECRSYTETIENRFTSQNLVVSYTDEFGNAFSGIVVAAGTSSTFKNVAPEPFGGENMLITSEFDSNPMDANSEKSADLNGDCMLDRVYGYNGTGTKGSW